MVLVDDYDKRTGEHYSIYLETFPIRVYDMDIKIILDTAYDKMIATWCNSIKCIDYQNVFRSIAAGKSIWITDIKGDEFEITRNKIAEGIGKALKIYNKKELLDFKNNLNTPCLSSELCDRIIQLAVFGKVAY